jgi:predicted AAA+ superfamily ATPase
MAMRYLRPYILEDLKKKMIFLGGPRQCGKTTLAMSLTPARHFNWDADEDRAAILKKEWTRDDKLIVFDELHKYPKWKNWIKGVYDTQKEQHQFLVTGSARMDVYRRGGDSLLGRYHYWRLHPFTLSELPAGMDAKEAFKRLLEVGGFPEPFLDGDPRQARRWRLERIDRVLKDDVRDLEGVRNIQQLSLFVDQLRARVGQLCVLSNMAADIQVTPATAAKWLEVLERMYLVFIVRPWTKNLPRAVQKPPKVFFFDNADVLGDEGARFENLVATHLLKTIQFLQDRDGYRYELRYIRDKEGREVDFAVVRDGKLIEIVEAKWSDRNVSKSLEYYAEKLRPARARQIVGDLKRPYDSGRIEVRSAVDALSSLEDMPK